MRAAIIALLTGLGTVPVIGVEPVAAAAAAPPLTAPADGATISANPVLEWQASSGAVKYRVQVSTTSAFTSFAYNAVTLNTKATPPTDLAHVTHYWRVSAFDASNREGDFSPVWSFTKATPTAPVPTSPSEGQVIAFPNESAQFSWEPMAGAKSYDIEIDDDSGFTPPLKATANTANASYTLTEPQTIGQTFYWRVRGKSAANLPTQFSAPRSFSFSWPNGAPTLTSPPDTNATAIEEVVLDWDPVLGAQEYEVEVSPNFDFTGTLTVDVAVHSTRYSPPTTLVNGAYFWRVRARNAAAPVGVGPWSAIRTFSKNWPAPDAPPFNRVTLLTPADNDFDVTEPNFSWTPVRLASRYELQLSTDVNFSPETISNCYTNHTALTPKLGCNVNPAPGITYYWRVRPIDDPKGVLGLFSPTFTFQYSPNLAIRTGPENGTTTPAPVLTWDKPEADIAKFRVTVYKSGGAVAHTADTINYSYTPVGLKPSDGPFTWKVQTIDAWGRVGPLPGTSGSFSLSVPTGLALPTPTVSAGISGIYAPPLTWDPVFVDEPAESDDDLADKYEIWYAEVGASVFHLLTNTPTLTAYSHTKGNLSAGTYQWFVKAFDGASLVAVGDLSTFVVLDLPVTTLTAPPHCPPLTGCANLLDTPTLKWNAVPRAGWYIVYLATDPNFTNVIKTYRTQYTTLTPQESLLDSQAGQATYWYARPCHDDTEVHCGPEPSTFAGAIAIRAFRKQSNPVQLVSPAEGAQIADEIRFDWTDYLTTNGGGAVTQEARTYRIQVSAAADFSTLLDEKVVDQTEFTEFDRTYPEGPIYWRVQAIDGSNNSLTWSAVRSLTKKSPAVTLLSPGHGATMAGVPRFAWSSQAYAARYEIEVYKNTGDPINATNRVLTVQTKQTAWTPTTALAAGTYGWRVRRLDADLRAGPWTAGTNLQLRLFTFAGSATTLINPADGADFVGDTLLFQWEPVAGAAQYRLQTSTSAGFTLLKENQTTVMTAWAPTSAYGAGQYFWRVVTLDGSSNVLATSAVRSFTKSLPPPPDSGGQTPNPGFGTAGVGSGYWMLSAKGDVYSFGDAKHVGNQAVVAQDLEPTPSGNGYWILGSTGGVYAKGDARHFGNASLLNGEEATSLSATPAGDGYWIFTTKGRVIALGNAPFKGDMSKTVLNGSVLDSVVTPSGNGYYMVASDGGIFSFGDAKFSGSMGGKPLNKPVMSMAPDTDGDGYWLVASDGGIFAFNAPFYGSTGSLALNKPVTGMVTGPAGYLMVAEDGGIFAFGNVKFHGSLGSNPPASPIVAVALLG